MLTLLLTKFNYHHCCISVIMRPSDLFISPHLVHGTVWAGVLWSTRTSLRIRAVEYIKCAKCSKVHNYLSNFLVIFLWSHDLENVTWCSVSLGVRRTPSTLGVYATAENWNSSSSHGYQNLGARDKSQKGNPKHRTICDVSCVKYVVFKRVPSSIPSKVRNWAIAQYHRQFAQCYLILAHFQHSKFSAVYIYRYSPLNVENASLFVCLHGCAVACASCATKQTLAQSRIFLEGTLVPSPDTLYQK